MTRLSIKRWAAPLLFALLTVRAGIDAPQTSSDSLAAEIERWSDFVKNHTSTDDSWSQVKAMTGPLVAKAEEARKDGQRFLALLRLSAARMYLAASVYTGTTSAEQRKDAAPFEAEWARVGKVLQADLSQPRPAPLNGLAPAAVRAVAEAALPQVRVYYETSREYGLDTMPQYGLLYLGAAQAQREFVDFCRTLSWASEGSPPPVRAIGPELDKLESELLEAYLPPAAIDRHSEFIAASSTLKEARELDEFGLRYGALLRYLQAVQRIAPLRGAPTPLDPQAITAQLKDFDRQLSQSGRDHTIGRIFLEAAQSDLAHPAPGAKPVLASTMVRDVLPRYFAALEPARPQPRPPAASVTVTLVRWPYT
jgi:hypothetical protein